MICKGNPWVAKTLFKQFTKDVAVILQIISTTVGNGPQISAPSFSHGPFGRGVMLTGGAAEDWLVT